MQESSERIYQFGEETPKDRWHVRDFAGNGYYRYAICGRGGATEAWTAYAEMAQLIVWALNTTNATREDAG